MPDTLFKQAEVRPKISIEQQLICAQRELCMRTGAYPKWVRSGKISEQAAEREIHQMEAIIETLRWCRDNRELIVKIKKQQGEMNE